MGPSIRLAGSNFLTVSMKDGGKDSEPRMSTPGGVDFVHDGSFDSRARSIIRFR